MYLSIFLIFLLFFLIFSTPRTGHTPPPPRWNTAPLPALSSRIRPSLQERLQSVYVAFLCSDEGGRAAVVRLCFVDICTSLAGLRGGEGIGRGRRTNESVVLQFQLQPNMFQKTNTSSSQLCFWLHSLPSKCVFMKLFLWACSIQSRYNVSKMQCVQVVRLKFLKNTLLHDFELRCN